MDDILTENRLNAWMNEARRDAVKKLMRECFETAGEFRALMKIALNLLRERGA